MNVDLAFSCNSRVRTLRYRPPVEQISFCNRTDFEGGTISVFAVLGGFKEISLTS